MHKTILSLTLTLLLFGGQAAAFNSNRAIKDERPSNQQSRQFNCVNSDLGTHAVVSRVAIDFLKNFSGNTQMGQAGNWIHEYASNTKASLMPQNSDRNDLKANAFLRGANAPDLLNTTVDTIETKICFGGTDYNYDIRILRVVIAGVTLWNGINLRLGLLKLAEMIEKIAKNTYLKAFFHHLARGLRNRQRFCVHRLDLPGSLPTHLAGMNHCIQGYRNSSGDRSKGYKVDEDPSVGTELGHVVEKVLADFIGQKIQELIRKLSGATRLLVEVAVGSLATWVTRKIGDLVNYFARPVLNWLKNDVLNRLVTFERRETTYVGQGASRRPEWKPRWKQAAMTRMQFESATARADWWYDRAVYYQGRRDEQKAVLCLAHAAHYLQDLSGVPQHTYGYMLRGHAEWETVQQCWIAEYWKLGRHYLKPKSIPSFFEEVKNRVKEYLGSTSWNHRDIPAWFPRPSSMSMSRIFPLMSRHYSRIRTVKLEDPNQTLDFYYRGHKFKRKYWEHDLINSAAATAWLIMKFYREVKLKGSPVPRGEGGSARGEGGVTRGEGGSARGEGGAAGRVVGGSSRLVVKRKLGLKSCSKGMRWDRRLSRCLKSRVSRPAKSVKSRSRSLGGRLKRKVSRPAKACPRGYYRSGRTCKRRR